MLGKNPTMLVICFDLHLDPVFLATVTSICLYLVASFVFQGEGLVKSYCSL